MTLQHLGLGEVALLTPPTFGDDRGWFRETYRRNGEPWSELGVEFVQANESLSTRAGTIRGLHFQISPSAQAKLVRVAHGAVVDVAADIRVGSPTYGRHVIIELSAANGRQLFVPAGFAHGFVTTQPDTVVSYQVSAGYDPDAERSIRWDDPDLAIAWGTDPESVSLSAKDAAAPLLADQPDLFSFEEYR